MPGCALASDQHYRETDLAIDFCEDVPPLPRAAVDRIVALMEARGHDREGELDPRQRLVRRYDKLTMTRTLLREAFGDRSRRRARRASSSPAIRRTTRRCSRFFPNAVGVANVRAFLDRIATPPRYVTSGEAGAGFAELADFLLAR